MDANDVEKDILLIDDDEDLSAITVDLLTDNGYRVEHRATGKDALLALEQYRFRLIILDVNLPDCTGFALCQRIRASRGLPILFISARTSDTDRITGLDIGGDDYIPKPYSLQELLSRVRANLRRSYTMDAGKTADIFYFDDVCVYFDTRRVTKRDISIELTVKEFDLLAYLIRHKNEALSKERLFNAVWGEYYIGEIGTLTVHIRWLREKIEDDPSQPKHIKTRWGVGYLFEE